MEAHTESSRRVEETRVESGRIKLPIALWAFLWTVALAILAGVWNAAAAYTEQNAEMKSLGRDFASQTRALQKLEKRIDTDNLTRYTVGEANRDFLAVTEALKRSDGRIDDHEARLRVLERARTEPYIDTPPRMSSRKNP